MFHVRLSLKVLAPRRKEAIAGSAHDAAKGSCKKHTAPFSGAVMVHCQSAEFKNRCSASSTPTALS
jgi:hypothetical protein